MIKDNAKPGTIVVTNPSVDILTGHLQLGFELDEWLSREETQMTAAKYAATDDEERLEEVAKICLYRVK